MITRGFFASFLAATILGCGAADERRRPNVVVVITDDQGYGDLGAHGNQKIRTPNLDRLHDESVRFTDFHVDPTCAPTRSALMTGRYSSRTGVWHTIMGRSILHRDETTLAEIFRQAGYATGMFGKWHLGDDWPYRPEDRGFQRVVRHGGGGIGQTPDWWGNDYFDDTYWVDGEPQPFEGYCTDVFFREALEFIERRRDEPFFVYLATNAPHGPYFVDERYSQPYLDAGVPEPMAQFYGMIENIDDNMGRLRAKLDELGIADDTILVFTTDNGTAAGVGADGQPLEGSAWGGFNAGMRGRKGSEYDGGHRVPFFLRWPNGGLGEPRDVNALAAHIDVPPTLAELAAVELPDDLDLDGASLAPLLRGEDWPERTLTVHSQRIEWPEKWRKSAVMTDRWRLVNGVELYDIEADPGQTREVSAEHPEVAEGLRQQYEDWWVHIADRFDNYVRLVIGEREEPSRLTAHDWHPTDDQTPPWNQNLIQKEPWTNGVWMVDVARPGRYEFHLLKYDRPAHEPLDAVEARVRVGDQEARTEVADGATEAKLEMELSAGSRELETALIDAEGRERGAFYVYVRRLGSGPS